MRQQTSAAAVPQRITRHADVQREHPQMDGALLAAAARRAVRRRHLQEWGGPVDLHASHATPAGIRSPAQQLQSRLRGGLRRQRRHARHAAGRCMPLPPGTDMENQQVRRRPGWRKLHLGLPARLRLRRRDVSQHLHRPAIGTERVHRRRVRRRDRSLRKRHMQR